MGDYGTTLKTKNGTVYFDSIENVKSFNDIKKHKENSRKNIENIKSRFKVMCAATPKDIFPSDSDGDTLFKMEQEFNDNWEWLETEMHNESEAIIAEDIVNDWEYNYSDDNLESPDTINIQKNWNKICPSEYYNNKPITNINDLKITDNSITDIINRADNVFNNINYELNTQNKFIAYYKGTLYTDISGRYLWSSKESAIKHIINDINIYSNDYIEKSYIQEHRDVLESFKEYVDWGMKIKPFIKNNIDTNDIEVTPELYDEYLNKMISNEKFDYNVFVVLGEIIKSALNNIIKQFITVVQI